MKIEQTPIFQPITITLESQKEADILWNIIIEIERRGSLGGTQAEVNFCTKLSNWLSENAQL